MWRGNQAEAHADQDQPKSKPARLLRCSGWWEKAGWAPRNLSFIPRSSTSLLWDHGHVTLRPHGLLICKLVRLNQGISVVPFNAQITRTPVSVYP